MHLRPFTNADHAALGNFTALSVMDDETIKVISPHRFKYPDHFRASFIASLKAKHAMPGVVTMVAETDVGDLGPNREGTDNTGGVVVGRITVRRFGESAVAQKWREVFPGNRVEACLLRLESIYADFFDLSMDRHSTGIYRAATSAPGPLKDDRFSEMWSVVNLVVDARYQRMGIGNLLMEWILRQAQAERVPIGLVASAMGRALYQKMGFIVLKDEQYKEGFPNMTVLGWFPGPKDESSR